MPFKRVARDSQLPAYRAHLRCNLMTNSPRWTSPPLKRNGRLSMPDPITGLVGDLRRLVLEIEKSQKQGDEEEKDKTEGRPLEGQIRTLAPDTILASKLRNAIVY